MKTNNKLSELAEGMKTKMIPLNDYNTGNRLGDVEVTEAEYFNIEARAQSPQGIFRADSLAPEEWSKLNIKADQTVYFDGTWE